MALFRRQRGRQADEPATLRPADEVWNRAAMDACGPNPRDGDRALAAMLRVHNVAMNGGLLHAVERRSDQELDEGVAGFRYFGLDAAAEIVDSVRAAARVLDDADDDAAEELEQSADRRYGEVVPDDSTLVKAFEHRFDAEPEAFAPAV